MKSPETSAFDLLVKESSIPGSCWRSAPFWALNGKLAPEELKTQIRGFHEKGLGGFYLHARTGLETPYLSKEWFSCINAAVDEAKKLDMEAWLYDEDRFPSGSGGGLITCDPACRAQGIVLMTLDPEELEIQPLPEKYPRCFFCPYRGEPGKKLPQTCG